MSTTREGSLLVFLGRLRLVVVLVLLLVRARGAAAECSRGITLYPGDLIATGTPSGVGMGMAPPTWLKPGDKVKIAIDGLGELENSFVAG